MVSSGRRRHSDYRFGVDMEKLISNEAPESIKRAVMVQRWTDLVFIHWKYPVETIQNLLPDGLEVDQYKGDAWVGLIPFHMDDLGFPLLHPLPFVGSFPEVNVRTYVRHKEYRGVYFFSLDINKAIPTFTARTLYRIPYCYGDVSHSSEGQTVTTKVSRRWPNHHISSHIKIQKKEAIDGNLERFLSARWGLITQTPRKKFLWAPVYHPPWVLQKANLLYLQDELITDAGFPEPEGEPHVMYSPGVPVRIGLPKII